MNEYQQKRHDAKVALVAELNSFDSGYKFELNSDGEECQIVLTGLVPAWVNYSEYNKQYNFYLDYQLPFVRFETYKEVAEKFTAPQNVGVLTAKKIKAWVDYLIKIYEELVVISAERVAKVNAFEALMVKNGANIRKDANYDTFSGSIIKNGIEFEFEVYNEGYISQKVSIHYSVDNSLEAFLKLSDNKYLS